MCSLAPEIKGPSAWYGPAMAASTDWLTILSVSEIGEVERVMRRVAAGSREIAAVGPDNFQLPTLGPRLRLLLDEVLNGRGFILIRGLPVRRWSKREAAI